MQNMKREENKEDEEITKHDMMTMYIYLYIYHENIRYVIMIYVFVYHQVHESFLYHKTNGGHG